MDGSQSYLSHRLPTTPVQRVTVVPLCVLRCVLTSLCVVVPSGTRLRFHRGSNVEWQDADDLRDSDDDSDDESMMVCTSLKVRTCKHTHTHARTHASTHSLINT